MVFYIMPRVNGPPIGAPAGPRSRAAAAPRHTIVACVIEMKRARHNPDDKRRRGKLQRGGRAGMRGEVDLSVLEPFTTQEIQSYIDYLWRSGATDVAAAVVAALRSAMPEPPDAAALSVMGSVPGAGSVTGGSDSRARPPTPLGGRGRRRMRPADEGRPDAL